LIQLGPAWVRFTGRAEGDMAAPGAPTTSVVDLPWTRLRQVHGADVVIVSTPGGGSGQPGDGAVSALRGAALAILTADCAPVAFASPEGVIGIAHAGWRGLVAGVISETVLAMRRLGAGSIQAALGPCIGPECYAFGPSDLDHAASVFGDGVRSVTCRGEPALDVAAAVRVAVREAGAELVWDAGICTSCSLDHWSWRARRDRQRQATVVWR
jgi:YfiH family protein